MVIIAFNKCSDLLHLSCSPLPLSLHAHGRRPAAAHRGRDTRRAAQVVDLTGGGDHFRAQVVSPAFEGMSRIQQHRLVYDVFGDEVGGPIHALSITTRTSQ